MNKRQKHSLSVLLLLALLLAPVSTASARGKGFKEIVKHIETNYRAKKTKIPLLGLANFAVKLIRPAGVKGFKLAVFEDQNFAVRTETRSFLTAMREAYLPEKGWTPLVQLNSKREGGSARTFIYTRLANANKKPQFDKKGAEKMGDVEFVVAVLDESEAVVVEAKFNADAAVRFLENPKIMGISLKKSIGGSNQNTMANNARHTPSAPKPNVDTTVSNSTSSATDAKRTVVVKSNSPEPAAPVAPPRPALKTGGEAESNVPVVQPATNVVEPRDPNAIRIETRLVNLNVKATDKKGLPLTELKPEDFIVYEDGIKQEIAHFKPVNAPVNVILLMDLSGSTKKKRKPMMEAARKFIDALPAQDKIQLVAFTRQYKPLSGFTSDKAALKLAVEKIKNISGGTSFYEALWKSLDQLGELREARKAIVVLTDGEDEMMLRRTPDDNFAGADLDGVNGNVIGYDKLLQRASEEDVTIYPIYYSSANHYDKLGLLFGGGGSFTASTKHRLARKQLDQLAEQTGGEVVNANYEDDLAGAYARVASELHTLYSMAYSPEKPKHDGGFRKIAVEVKRDGSVAKTRRGYYDK